MDKIISCIKCQKTFVITAQKQYFYYCRNFPLPKRCPQCLEERKESRKREVANQRKLLYESIEKNRAQQQENE